MVLDHLIMVVDGEPDRLPEVLDVREGSADEAVAAIARVLSEAEVHTTDEFYGAVALHYVVPGTKLVQPALAFTRHYGGGEYRANIHRADGSHIVTVEWEVG